MPEPCATCKKLVPPAEAALCRRALGRVLCWACRKRRGLEPDDERPFYWQEPWSVLAAEHEALASEETRG